MRHAIFRLLLLVATLAAFQASAAPRAAHVARRLFVLPDDSRFVGEIGRLAVPETDKPRARQIDIAFARLRSTSAHPGPPIFWVDGGPGASSIDGFVEKAKMIAMLREYGDVIAVDQRGGGDSEERLDCLDRWNIPVDRAITRRDVIDDTRRIFLKCAAEWRAAGADLDGYNSAAYADDLFRVADALGYGKIRLYAFSYGTQIALAALARHPQRLDRVAVFGVMGLDDSLRPPLALDEVLKRGGDMLAGSSAGKAYPRLEALAAAAVRKVDRTPMMFAPGTITNKIAGPVAIDGAALRAAILTDLGSRAKIGGLPRLLDAIVAGKDLAPLHDELKAIVEDMLWERRGPAQRRNALQQYATVCASGISAEARAALMAGRSATVIGQPMHYGLPEACDALGVADVGQALRAAPAPAVPLLLVGGTIDIKTPLAQAQAVAKRYPRATLVTIAGAAHNDLTVRPEVIPDVRAFLEGRPLSAHRIELDAIQFAPPL